MKCQQRVAHRLRSEFANLELAMKFYLALGFQDTTDQTHLLMSGTYDVADKVLEATNLAEGESLPGVLGDGDREYLDAKFAEIAAAQATVDGAKVDEIHDNLFNTLVEPLNGIGTRELTLSDGSTKTWDMESDGVRRTRVPK
jgi:hypothetical protein